MEHRSGRRRLFVEGVIILLAICAVISRLETPKVEAMTGELFFSEYIEGSSNNKALEIYNGTGSSIDLLADGYNVQMFFNGGLTAALTINLTGTVAHSDVYVLAQASANATILAQADQTNGSGWFNGDDAIVLRKGTTVIDSIGVVGTDPGSEWGAGLASTADNSLRRGADVCAGDTNLADAFDPATEWAGFATDTFDGLGLHAASCDGLVNVSIIATPDQASEGSPAPAIIIISRTGDLSAALEVAISVAGTATPGDDYSPAITGPGDVVQVTGTVAEFSGQTQITPAPNGIELCGSTASVIPVELVFPLSDADFERHESMLVTFPQPLVISEYFNYDRFGELVLALPLAGETRPYTGTAIDEPGAAANQRALENSLRRITLDDGRGDQNPGVLRHPNGNAYALDNLFRGGDLVTGATGVLDYRFSLYRIQPTAPATYTSTNPRPAAPAVGGSVQVAAFNTLNYFLTLDYPSNSSLDNACGPAESMECRGADSDQPQEFARQRAKLLAALLGLDADIFGLIEIENTPGVDPLGDIAAGLNGMLGTGTYAAIDTGVIGTDAIRVGFVYRPGVVTPVGPFKILDSSVDPRFIDTKSRPVLAQTFVENATGERFTVAVAHLKSKGSDCNDVGDFDAGDGQGNCSLTRTLAAEALVDWLATDPTGSSDPDFLVIGDLNAYAREDPIDAVLAGADGLAGTDDDFVNLLLQFQGAGTYSYVFDGQFGYLDHALASASLVSQVTGAGEWHINSDEPDILDYDTSFKSAGQIALYEANAFRSSDHDPVLIGLGLIPADTDGDGIPDSTDFCISEAEDLDGIQDSDGCPEVDADNDGVADTADQCPLLAEDLDGLADADGCPETDADGDSVADSVDQCPLLAASPALRGCPEACFVPATIVGTNGNDLILGTPGDDVIWAGKGNDRIIGNGGNDIICAGDGNDVVITGNGNDIISTGSGNDEVTSGDGDDYIDTGEGNDRVTAGNGRKFVSTGDGNDTVTTGDGDDTIFTGSGNDSVRSGGGSDTIDTGDGNDDVSSGAGADIILTGAGNDSIDAGDGNDFISAGAGNDNINGGADFDVCLGGPGNNRIRNCEA